MGELPWGIDSEETHPDLVSNSWLSDVRRSTDAVRMTLCIITTVAFELSANLTRHLTLHCTGVHRQTDSSASAPGTASGNALH